MSLDYKTDHSIRYVSGEEARSYDGKFDWALQEEPAGRTRQTTLYPWRWGLSFQIFEITLKSSFGDSNFFRKMLSAKLSPEKNARGSVPRYSFLGTERAISKFGLEISPWDKDHRHAQVDGCVGFDYENDFKQHTIDDYLNIELYLPVAEFEVMASKVEQNLVGNASIYLKGVGGFYAQWDPGISTHEIKVIWPDLEIVNGDSEEAEERILTQGSGISSFEIHFLSPTVANSAEDQNKPLFDELVEESSPALSDEPMSNPDHLDNLVWMMARLNSIENKLAWIAAVSTITAGVLVWMLIG